MHVNVVAVVMIVTVIMVPAGIVMITIVMFVNTAARQTCGEQGEEAGNHNTFHGNLLVN